MPIALLAQRKCGTMYFNQEILKGPKELRSTEHFEEWLQRKKSIRPLRMAMEEVYEIPVVFHIIHNGEEEGTESNLSTTRINQQLTSLNNDFRRLNSDASSTPAEFLGVAADTHIEFVLARQDPEGLPTTGIERYEGSVSEYNFDDALILSSIAHWPSDEYLNIWVANLVFSSEEDLLGFAQFPIADLDGLNGSQELHTKTDGVYANYKYVGNNSAGTAFASRGRTLTHEVGHWLGLRHVWGDGACGVDDFCLDTPLQEDSSFGCIPDETESCEEGQDRMYQNYMDYTDDLCMNLFTTCQTGRMRTVLENSPRRTALLNSKGGEEAVLATNDLGIRNILSPGLGNCTSSIIPEVEVRNYGSNSIESFTIQVLIDEQEVETMPVTELTLATGDISIVTFNIQDYSAQGTTTFKITQVNGTTDGNADNDCVWQSVTFPSTTVIPLNESFESAEGQLLNTWSVISPDASNNLWSFTTAPNETETNRAAMLPYAIDNSQKGSLDLLMTPAFNLTGVLRLDISFKYAYSANPANFSDGLFVLVSTDCGSTFDLVNPLFSRWSPSMATVAGYEENFTPSESEDWQTVQLNTGALVNEEHVVFAFAGLNGGGNNIYVDDIFITSTEVNENDASFNRFVDVPIAGCESSFTSSVEIKNLGIQTLNSVTLSYGLGIAETTETFSNLNIESGKTDLLPITFSAIEEGENTIAIALSSPNGETDDDNSNNTGNITFISNQNQEHVPFRERFSDEESYSMWSILRTDATTDLRVFPIDNDNDALLFNGFTNQEIGAENWFISPSLDVSEYDSASMQFDVSYAYRTDRNDRLQVFVSSDCGRTYDSAVYDKRGLELAVIESGNAWLPTNDTSDWKTERIGLSQFAGQDDMQVAFKITNQNGNNLYIDNIEFFDLGTPYTFEIEKTMSIFPNPATSSLQLLFNFNIKEEVRVQIVSLSGEIMYSGDFPNTLNQLYTIDGLSLNSGIYILQVKGANTNLRERLIFL